MLDLKSFRRDKKIGQAAIQEILNCKQSYVSAIENGDRPISQDALDKLQKAYGEEIAPYITADVNIANNYNQSTNFTGVPYYDIDVTGSITGSFSDIKEIPEFHVDFKPFNDCTAYLPIYGDSMYPQFCSGEIIAIKEWKNKDVILWGEPYLIITNSECNSLRTIKLVFPHDDQENVILRASNPNFKGDTVVPKRCITAFYIIKGKITRKQL